MALFFGRHCEADEGEHGNLPVNRGLIKRCIANFNRLLPASCLAMTITATFVVPQQKNVKPINE